MCCNKMLKIGAFVKETHKEKRIKVCHPILILKMMDDAKFLIMHLLEVI